MGGTYRLLTAAFLWCCPSAPNHSTSNPPHALINVFRNEMSLVGPRPYLPEEAERMGDFRETVVKAPPGITGLYVCSRTRLPRQRFHDLRHAAASLLLAQGVNPRVVMEILGHSQISLTLNTYAHVIPSLQREAASKMDAMLSESR